MTFSDLPRIENFAGKDRAIIYRISKDSQTEPCPFCNASHSLKGEDGLRDPVCIPMHRKGNGVELVVPKTMIMSGVKSAFIYDGLILKTVDVEDSIFRK